MVTTRVHALSDERGSPHKVPLGTAIADEDGHAAEGPGACGYAWQGLMSYRSLVRVFGMMKVQVVMLG